MSLLLGFVKNKMSLAYGAYKADKMPNPGDGENRRAKARKQEHKQCVPARSLLLGWTYGIFSFNLLKDR